MGKRTSAASGNGDVERLDLPERLREPFADLCYFRDVAPYVSHCVVGSELCWGPGDVMDRVRMNSVNEIYGGIGVESDGQPGTDEFPRIQPQVIARHVPGGQWFDEHWFDARQLRERKTACYAQAGFYVLPSRMRQRKDTIALLDVFWRTAEMFEDHFKMATAHQWMRPGSTWLEWMYLYHIDRKQVATPRQRPRWEPGKILRDECDMEYAKANQHSELADHLDEIKQHARSSVFAWKLTRGVFEVSEQLLWVMLLANREKHRQSGDHGSGNREPWWLHRESEEVPPHYHENGDAKLPLVTPLEGNRTELGWAVSGENVGEKQLRENLAKKAENGVIWLIKLSEMKLRAIYDYHRKADLHAAQSRLAEGRPKRARRTKAGVYRA